MIQRYIHVRVEITYLKLQCQTIQAEISNNIRSNAIKTDTWREISYK